MRETLKILRRLRVKCEKASDAELSQKREKGIPIEARDNHDGAAEAFFDAAGWIQEEINRLERG